MSNLDGQWIGTIDGSRYASIILNIEPRNATVAQLVWCDDRARPGFCAHIDVRPGQANIFGEQLRDFKLYLKDSGRLCRAGVPPEETAFKGEQENGAIRGSLRAGSEKFEFTLEHVLNTRAFNTARCRRATKVMSWDDFTDWAEQEQLRNEKSVRRRVYRGQESSDWELQTSFHRAGRLDIPKYFAGEVCELRERFNQIVNNFYKRTPKGPYDELLTLGQHHGFPTPLLDWTTSPVVAAYFAYRRDPCAVIDKVRIYAFDRGLWEGLYRQSNRMNYVDVRPNIRFIDCPMYNNPRAWVQKSVLTFSNIDNMEYFVSRIRDGLPWPNYGRFDFLEIIELPAGEKLRALDYLRARGIAEDRLFPNYDEICRGLKASW